MPKVTFEVPDELKKLMDEHPELNWSEVLRQAVRREAHAAEIAREILKEESDPRVRAVARALKRGVGRRYREDVKRARRD